MNQCDPDWNINKQMRFLTMLHQRVLTNIIQHGNVKGGK